MDHMNRVASRVHWIVLLTIAVISFTESFVVPSQTIHGHPIYLDKNDGEGADDAPETRANGAKKDLPQRRRRIVDFPPFCYGSSSKRKPKGGQSVLIRVKSPSGSEENVYRTKAPKFVSIPQPQERPRSLLGRAAQGILTAAFELSPLAVTESARRTRLILDRSYARKEPFAYENITVPPSLSDLSPPRPEPWDGFWISAPARIGSYVGAYFLFPFVTRFVDMFTSMEADQLDEITSKFGPGISILYGTFISLTLSILYNRQRNIQDNVAIECSCLAVMVRNLLSLFKDDRDLSIEAGQCAADQIRTLVRSSRGAELMILMYSDPYSRMLELVDIHEEKLFRQGTGAAGRSGSLIGNCRDVGKDLYRLRANRLSDEALALPPTHFLVLNILTLLILLGYTVSIIPTLDASGNPSVESSALFSVLTTIYLVFFNFASDLNNPFKGVYQIRRSCAASHLLQLKWLIANHPLLRGEVDFEQPEEASSNKVQVRSPGLGDMWFEKDEIFLDSGLDDADSDEENINFL
jgi:hypothetical protein